MSGRPEYHRIESIGADNTTIPWSRNRVVADTHNEVETLPSWVKAGYPVAQRPLLDRFLIGIVATLAVAIVRWWFDPLLGNHLTFTFFHAAIVVTAWYSGFWPAILVMLMGFGIADYCFDIPRGDFRIYTLHGQLGCTVYLVIGTFLSCLVAWLMRNIAHRLRMERALQASQEQLQLRQIELAHMSRLSTMGEMAAGLAHELNQPLHAAKNYARGCSPLAQGPGT